MLTAFAAVMLRPSLAFRIRSPRQVTILLGMLPTLALACAGKSVEPLVAAVKAPCANEPAGYTLAQDRSFIEMPGVWPAFDSFGWQSNGGAGSPYVANLALVSDASVKPLTPDGTTSVLQMTFPQGWEGGSAPVWFGSPKLPANRGAIYMCVVVKLDPRWTNGGNTGTKFFFLRTPYDDGAFKENHYWGLAALETDPKVAQPMFGTQFGSSGPDGTSRYSIAGTNAAGGVWRQIEVVMVAEHPAGATNGSGQMWLDGKPVLNDRDIQFFLSGQTPSWASVEVEPTYGGGTHAVPYNMTWWLGRVRISVK
jgi:hypothetical protein